MFNVLSQTTNNNNTIVFHIEESGRPAIKWNEKSIPKLSQYHEFKFKTNKIVVNKFSNIGEGKCITISETVQNKYKIYWQSIKQSLRILLITEPTVKFQNAKMARLSWGNHFFNSLNDMSGLSNRFKTLQNRKQKVSCFD